MFLIDILGNIMRFCYSLFENYGIAIIIFTFISKIVLLPISIWVQKNSIKMVEMQPDINKIKIKYFGDNDTIADEESKLYKKYRYNPFSSVVPLVIQIFLLLGLIAVINKPMTYIVKTPKYITNKFVSQTLENNKSLDPESSSLEISVVKDVKKNKNSYEKVKRQIGEQKYNDTISKIKKLNMKFLGFDLGWVASIEKGITYIIPILAGLSALVLAIGQNMMNVLQTEQSKLNKYGMVLFSVGLSLYLGMYVSAGVVLYWIISNLLAVLLQWILNIFIDPKKHVNYDELHMTSQQLSDLKNLNKKVKRTKEQKKKEKEDYKKFFKIANKHLVFYSESNGFYKYYKGFINYILENTNIIIHYITSDYYDNIFELEKTNPQINGYYIEEKKLITMMMKMDADVVVMTMPDIENFHIKRSYVRKDIDYVYVQHGMDSLNLTLRKKAIAYYDSIFVTGQHQKEECLEENKLYGLKDRKIIEVGYPLLDELIEEHKNIKPNKKQTILIAPSWQANNIIDLCLDKMLENLQKTNYKIILRPHPQHVRHEPEKFKAMKEKYNEKTNITVQTDFSSNETVFQADLLITDWSSIAQEYAFSTKKPVLYIDTPLKIMNPDYKKIKVEPFNIWARYESGEVLKVEDISKINEVVKRMIKDHKKYSKKITKLVDEYVYNVGNSSEVGAKYIIDSIQQKVKERREKNEKN